MPTTIFLDPIDTVHTTVSIEKLPDDPSDWIFEIGMAHVTVTKKLPDELIDELCHNVEMRPTGPERRREQRKTPSAKAKERLCRERREDNKKKRRLRWLGREPEVCALAWRARKFARSREEWQWCTDIINKSNRALDRARLLCPKYLLEQINRLQADHEDLSTMDD